MNLIEAQARVENAKAEDVFLVEYHEWFHADGSRCRDAVCGKAFRDALAVSGSALRLQYGDPWLTDDGTFVPLVWHEPRLKWVDTIVNLVTTAGLNHLMSRSMRSTALGGASGGYNDGRRLPTKWLVNTAYVIGDIVRPSGGSAQIDNNRFFVCRIAGTSHASTEPTWSNTQGADVTDNTVTWQEASALAVGLVDGTSAPTYAAADTMASHAGWTEGVPYSDAFRQLFTPGAVAAGSCDNSAAKAVFNINATLTVAGCFLTDIKTKSGSAGLLYGEGNFTAGSRAVQSGDTLSVTVTTSVS